MTMMAVLNGSRFRPGQYWNLPGTFLFAVYIMSALGFGAPLPQTIEGKAAVLIYAALAIPIHFLFMINVSTCIVVHAQGCVELLRRRLCEKRALVVENTTLDDESPNCSRHSSVLKSSSHCSFSRKVMCSLSILCACSCIPLTAALYYLAGACVFGMLQDLEILKIFMFPLEFTTSGALDHIPGYIRVLYGLYVEGAMLLIGCALATFRRCSIPGVLWIAEKYKLFATED